MIDGARSASPIATCARRRPDARAKRPSAESPRRPPEGRRRRTRRGRTWSGSRSSAACAIARVVGGWLEEPSRRLETIDTRHPDVHQDDVRPVSPRQSDGRIAVGRLGDDLDVRLCLEDHAEPCPNQDLVIGDHDAKASGRSRAYRSLTGAGSSGSHARTAYPPPNLGPASNRPPTSDARSRMPTRPRPLPSPSAVAGPSSRISTPKLVGLPAQPDERGGLTRVAERIGEGLLDDPVDRRVQGCRYAPRRTVDLETRGKTGLADPVDEGRQCIDPGLRRDPGRLVVSLSAPRKRRSSAIASRPTDSTASIDCSACSGEVRTT